MDSGELAARSNRIAVSDAGISMRYDQTDAAPIAWEDVARVTASAFEVGMNGDSNIFRHVTFGLIYGEFLEIALETPGLAHVLEVLGEHMEVVVPDPVAAATDLPPGAEPTVLATARA